MAAKNRPPEKYTSRLQQKRGLAKTILQRGCPAKLSTNISIEVEASHVPPLHDELNLLK